MTQTRRSPGSESRATSTTPIASQHDTAAGTNFALASQQVSWSDVHAFVLPKLIAVGDWPMIGSPAWCALDEYDPAKWAGVLDAAQHWALRVEYFQQASCDASREISAAMDWSAHARFLKGRADFFAARPWLGRDGWSR